MRNLWIAIAVLGCGKSKPAEPYKGPLTVDLVMSAGDTAKVFQPWDEGFANLQAKLGPPTKIEGKKHYWAAMAGNDCAYFYVEKEDGKQYNKDGLMVGTIQNPGKYGKDGAIMNRAECLDLVGKGVAPEDPNTPPPPINDSDQSVAVTVAEFRNNAVRGRSKWGGAKIKITGMLNQSGDTAYLYENDLNKDKTVRCAFDKPDTTNQVGKQVTLKGVVKIEKLVTGAGEPGMEASFEHCTYVTELPAK